MYGDDLAIVGGPARIDGKPVMVIGHQKGRDTKERVRRNYGMPKPEGYRKALRLMRTAERFGLPLVTFIARPAHIRRGFQRTQPVEAIARNLFGWPSGNPLTLVIGEGVGRRVGLGVCDLLLMLHFSLLVDHA